MRLNYYYNFKNTIRFFLDIENMDFSSADISKKTWSEPLIFRIRKDSKAFRTLQIPNIYNFYIAYEYYKTKLNEFSLDFEKFEELDSHKRMEISYELGEFKENNYDKWQLIDYNKLIEYDYLLRFDIKSFYEKIYTHYILNDLTNDKNVDKYLSHMNNGRTAGIIMGNYISLFMAELLSKKISKSFEEKLIEKGIKCYFSYFSDDFYIFVDKNYIDYVTDLFDEVLEKYDLTKNEDKIKMYDYLKYTNDDKIEKYWKIITSKCSRQQYSQELKIIKGKLKYNNNLFFTNQLIYRLNKLEDYRLKRVFIINFFKSKFFRKIDFSNTYINKYNYHQILYLIKEFPEIILYIDKILNSFEVFKSNEFKNTIVRFYVESLRKNYHDEQLYLFFLLDKLDCLEKVGTNEINLKVIDTKNSILISYYLKKELFTEENINIIRDYDEEKYWLIYYYLILKDADLYSNLENSIIKYLIPKSAREQEYIDCYKEFYYKNLSNKTDILLDFDKVKINIDKYFKIKYKED